MIPWLILFSLWGPADADYSRGMALARAGQWKDAAAAFRSGALQSPHDKRFPLEMAGVEFKQKNYAAAKRHLATALRIDPGDSYANGFLATLFLLDGNLEAALKYWNRAGGPKIDEVRVEPEPATDAMLLDRAFAFAPKSTLLEQDYSTTRARLDLLDLFPGWRIALQPRDADDAFDAVLHAPPGRTWLAMLRGLGFETVYPEVRDLGHRGVNVTSLLRWDKEKRRASAALAGPLGRRPEWRYRLYADGRNENWLLPGKPGFNLKRLETGAEIESAVSGRLGWKAAMSFSDRRYVNAGFAGGRTLEGRGGLRYSLLRIPEHRFTLESGGNAVLGRFFGRGLFSQLDGSLHAHWFPRARGEDYETSICLRGGRGTGPIPFDELPMLGLERDNDLWMRAHIGTAAGRKGSAPMGPAYLLANSGIDKIVRQGSFYRIRIGPFLDVGRVYGPAATRFGASGWLVDTGLEAAVRLLGAAEIVFTYGRDLRAGRNAWYALSR